MSDKKEFYDVVDALIELGHTIEASLKDDGKITWKDLPKFAGFSFKLLSALIGANKIRDELMSWDDDDHEELVDYIRENLDYDDDEKEEYAEDLAEMVIDFYTFFTKWHM